MVASMAHRGPDDQGLWAGARAALGQARLAIIDLSPGGHQPMLNAEKTIAMVFNGEIYSYQQERARLEAKGVRFRSTSDTEVLLALYEREGTEFLARLRGIFALAIVDGRRGPGCERLVLARDHFGVKPMLYAKTAAGYVFSSELKALLASDHVAREIDHEALRTLLCFGSVTQPRTLLAGVRQLPSGHVLMADESGERVEAYWQLGTDRVSGLRRASYGDIVAHVREAIVESVRLQMVADVPVGAFLSGGVDSSLIVALMTQAAGARIKTFSVGFEHGAAANDESEEAAEIAALLGTDHTRVEIGARDVEAHLLRFAAGLDQPSVDGMNAYFVSGRTGENVKVALSGTGGDELFAGYPWFAGVVGGPGDRATRSLAFVERLKASLGAGAGDDGRLAADRAFLDSYGRLYHCFGPDRAAALMNANHVTPMADDLAPLDSLPDADVLDRVGALCLNGYTRNQLLRDIDVCAMAGSLEVRVPFLDPVIADIALSLPREAKLAPGGSPLTPGASYVESGVKRVVVDAARSFLPPEFFARRGKKGFSLPFSDWMGGVLRPVLDDTLSEESVRARGLLDPKAVAAERRLFLEGSVPWNGPWLLMILELWAREVLDRPGVQTLRATPYSALSPAR